MIAVWHFLKKNDSVSAEEELVRLQAQEEFMVMHPITRRNDHWHSLALWLFCLGVLMGLWQVVKALAVT